MSYERFRQFEDAFDSGKLTSCSFSQECFADLLSMLAQSKWREVLNLSEHFWDQAKDEEEKAFVLQWLVISCEKIGDHERRERLIERWKEIPNWGLSIYCRFLKTYQEGLTYFFHGELHESEVRLRLAYEISLELHSLGGQMRSLFHLALIRRDQGDPSTAIEFFEWAFAIAKSREAHSWSGRISEQREVLGKGSDSSDPQSQLIRFIEGQQTEAARSFLCLLERGRRKAGLSRKVHSYFIYLPAIFALRGKKMNSVLSLRSIRDPVLKAKAAMIKSKVISLSEEEKWTLEHLEGVLGRNRVIRRSSLKEEDTEICGIRLSQVSDSQVRSLLLILLRNPLPVEKEQICRQLWNLSYDPVVHDGRIYKLLHKARRAFGRRDLIVNTYGSYQLNPELLSA